MPNTDQTHPPLDQLHQFRAGQLPAESAAQIREHLNVCPQCRQAIAQRPADTQPSSSGLEATIQHVPTDPARSPHPSSSNPQSAIRNRFLPNWPTIRATA